MISGRSAQWLLLGIVGPFILLTFMIVFQGGSYQYWGDKYHAVLSSQYLFSRIEGVFLAGPLWREDTLSGNIWHMSLGATTPFMVDTVAARLFHLSPVGIDLVSNLIGYFVAVGAMYLYLRRVLIVGVESASVVAVCFAASGYILSVWTGCANDFSTTGLLPALLVMSHRVKVATGSGISRKVVLPWIGLSLLVYACAVASSIKTLPILFILVASYSMLVFRTIRSTLLVILALMTGFLLYSPWVWLSWDAARISQRFLPSFVPSVSFGLPNLFDQVLVVFKRIASGFNVYGIWMPAILVIGILLVGFRENLKRADSQMKSILQFSALAVAVCFSMDVFAVQINDLKRDIPLVSAFDVVRFEWFVSFFTLVPVAWVLDNMIGYPAAEGSFPVTNRRLGWAVLMTAIPFALQATHITYRTLQVPSSIYPQNLVLLLYLVLYVALSMLVLILIYKGLNDRSDSYRTWCLRFIALSVLFQASVIGYRHGVENANRTHGDEPIMTYAERFSVPDDLTFLKDLNRFDDRVIDLTRPFDRVLTTPGSTALPLAGLRTPVGYTNTFPRWYDRFIARGVNGKSDAPSRFVEIARGPDTNFRVLHLLGVKYVLAYDGMDIQGYRPLHQIRPMGKTIYEALPSVGPAFVSSESSCVSSDEEALDVIHAADYQTLVRRAVLVSSDPKTLPFCENATIAGQTKELASPVRIHVSRENDKISVEVQSVTGGILTLADTYYPEWKGFVDGVEVPVLRTYTTFRGVLISPGYHVAEFLFSPKPFWSLFWLSNGLLTVLLLVAAWIHLKARRYVPRALNRPAFSGRVEQLQERWTCDGR